MRSSQAVAATAMTAVPSASAEGGEGTLYIINLSSANSPMLLEAPDAPELGGFAVFRSRRVEDGRDRFRLHLGYFDSQEQAEKFLPLVRERYPAAWVASAPQDSMGSLDDTSVAQFKFIPHRKANANANAPAVAAKSAAPAKTPVPPIAPATKASAPSSMATTISAEQFLEAEDVLSLLESPPRTLPSMEEAKAAPAPVAKAPAPSRTPAPAVKPKVAAPAPVANAAPKVVTKPAPTMVPSAQSFAVQLIWSAERPDTSQLPRLAIFDAYTMYTVTVQRGGRVWYGLRLGFFSDPVSARQVSLYVRSDFSAASVVPVSERECGRAEEAAKVVLQKEITGRHQIKPEPTRAQPAWAASIEELEAKEQEAAKQKAAPVVKVAPTQVSSAQAQFKKSLENLEKPFEPARRKAQSVKKEAGRKGNPSSTEELMHELGAHAMSLEEDEGNTFTDTGVRHLSVAVVKPKKKLGGLFGKK